MNRIMKKALLASLAYICTLPLAAQRVNSDLDAQLRKFVIVESAISQLYVDTVNIGKMTEGFFPPY